MHVIIIDSMTSVFNTDDSLPYNHNLFENFMSLNKRSEKVRPEGYRDKVTYGTKGFTPICRIKTHGEPKSNGEMRKFLSFNAGYKGRKTTFNMRFYAFLLLLSFVCADPSTPEEDKEERNDEKKESTETDDFGGDMLSKGMELFANMVKDEKIGLGDALTLMSALGNIKKSFEEGAKSVKNEFGEILMDEFGPYADTIFKAAATFEWKDLLISGLRSSRSLIDTAASDSATPTHASYGSETTVVCHAKIGTDTTSNVRKTVHNFPKLPEQTTLLLGCGVAKESTNTFYDVIENAK
ncbi:hypothetical protein CLF_112218 [Clonorchis sinensis]|uniref:Uncharacterized protein n=1 Tax=Clonorchis sinensis TaxID=79923 RepID=G7YW01_CLOSI|nr:hypothetical protein CLF_112218 [Clonorchis sinensis]